MPTMPAPWNDLDAKRAVCDAPADAVIEPIFLAGQIEAVNRLFDEMVTNAEPVPPGLPDYVCRFLEQTRALPAWADQTKIIAGQRLFDRHGPVILMLLFCQCLPLAYAAGNGVQVIHRTARMRTDLYRRAVETARLLVDVLSKGGLGPDGRGIRSAQKVRLMHAAIRRMIHADSTWDPNYGEPLNQEDLAGLLMSFSVATIEGLERVGVDLTDEEAEAYLHVWLVVGHILGIERDLLPASVADGLELAREIQKRQFRDTPEGRELTKALAELARRLVPGRLLDGIPETMTRYLIGAETADLIGVGPSDWSIHFIRLYRKLNKVMDDWGDESEAHRRVSEYLGAAIVRGMQRMEEGDDRVRFHIPEQLRQEWKVDSLPEPTLWARFRHFFRRLFRGLRGG